MANKGCELGCVYEIQYMSRLIHDRRAKRQPTWIIRWKDQTKGGKYSQVTLHCSKSEARKLQRKYDDMELPIHQNTVISIPLGNAVDQFLAQVELTRKHNTHEAYKYQLKHITDFFGKSRLMNTITLGEYAELFLTVRRKYPVTSYNTFTRHMRAYIYWAVDKHYLQAAPKMKVESTKDHVSRGVWLDDDQLNKIFTTDKPYWGHLYELLFLTGARIGELLNTDKDQINLKDGHITLKRNQTKSGREERLYLNDRAVEILEEHDENPLFPHTYNAVRIRINRLRDKLKFHFTAHDLRRSAGAHLIKRGVGIYEVSKFLRHSSVTITEKHYLRLTQEDHKHIADHLYCKKYEKK